MNCIFCKIAAGELNSDIVYEDKEVLAFRDIRPQAPTHILIIPRQHIETTYDLDEKSSLVIGKLFYAAKKITAELELTENGYRLVMNCNGDGGQTVFHIHLHLIAGRQMHWPPG